MEGPLLKWTNVMQGWQYRWFVLDSSVGILSYYTSKEKMMRGARRGCVRLKGAIVGIDDEDDSIFTITDDTKTFHCRAHDLDERDKWIQALETTVIKHSTVTTRWELPSAKPTMEDFDTRLTESDAYLQLLIDQSENLEKTANEIADPNEKARFQLVISNLNQIIESVKHCIVLLQIAKNTAFPVYGTAHTTLTNQSCLNGLDNSMDKPVVGIEMGHDCVTNKLLGRTPVVADLIQGSYSSSDDDDDFVDAYDFYVDRASSPNGPRFIDEPVESLGGSRSSETGGGASGYHSPSSQLSEDNSSRIDTKSPLKIVHGNSTLTSDSKNALDYDSMYEEDDEELGSLEAHGSIIHHLLSQVKIGMDLTKVVLPTFILERRSLLEMYADFFAHPDLFCSIVDYSDPKDRMVQVLKWYLSAFHAGRKSEVAKKPYNPILGEVFKCHWDVGNACQGEPVKDGPVPWAKPSQLAFVAEQVSHHPPVSAFYAEHKSKRISFCGHIWTKSKFLGLSVCVNNIGQGCVSLLDLDEEYIVNFPSGYGRSILTVPWVELGGTCQITCNKTGYNANIDFITKPFYGGKKHKINAEVFKPGEKKPFLTVEGEWNGRMLAKWNNGIIENFIDTVTLPTTKKKVKPVLKQETNESRFLWKEVTAGLKCNNIDQATGAKYALEQVQREEAKDRKTKGIDWKTKLFNLEGENWVYKKPLQKRLK